MAMFSYTIIGCGIRKRGIRNFPFSLLSRSIIEREIASWQPFALITGRESIEGRRDWSKRL